jgi:hypothetical protein
VDAVLPGKVNDSVHRLVDATGKYGGEEKFPVSVKISACAIVSRLLISPIKITSDAWRNV